MARTRPTMSAVAVAPDAFGEWIAHTSLRSAGCAMAIDAVPERFGGPPDGESRAMTERAEETALL
jgi:hypothetical protein